MGSTRTVALWGRFQPGFSKKRMKREAAKKKEAEGEGVTRCDCHCRSVVSSINPSIHPSINHISSDTKPFVYSCMQHDPNQLCVAVRCRWFGRRCQLGRPKWIVWLRHWHLACVNKWGWVQHGAMVFQCDGQTVGKTIAHANSLVLHRLGLQGLCSRESWAQVVRSASKAHLRSPPGAPNEPKTPSWETIGGATVLLPWAPWFCVWCRV